MIKTTQTTPLKFSTDVEYSTNGGNSWTTLLANTLLELDAITISVRTASQMTELDTWTTAVKDASTNLSEINVRQGKHITTLLNTFNGMSLNKLRLANFPVCTSLQSTVQSATIGELEITNFPSVLTATSLAVSAKIGLVHDLHLPVCNNFQTAFSGGEYNIMGDISNNSVPATLFRMFYGSTIKSIPRLVFENISNFGDLGRSSTVYYALYSHLKCKFTSANAGYLFATATNIKFSGFHYHVLNGSTSGGSRYVFHQTKNPDFIYPCSKITMQATNQQFISNVSGINAFAPDVTASQIALATTIGAKYSIEFNNWLPDLKLLASFDNVNTQAVAGALQYGSYLYNSSMVDQTGNLLIANAHASIEDTVDFEKTGKVYPTGNVWYARNGWYITYDSVTLELYNTSDVLQQSITLADVLHVSINSSATKMVTVSGNDVVIISNSITTTNQKISEYDLQTGSLVAERNVVGSNTSIKGVHRPDDSSSLCVLTSTYVSNSVSNVLTSSVIETFISTTATTPIVALPTVLPMDYMHTSHREENEFYVREKATGKCEWYFAK